jgi:hypothetical protein
MTTPNPHKSVFFPQLPTELWFIIYKMEHSSFLSSVNAEIKNLSNEVEHVNMRMFNHIPVLFMRPIIMESIAWNVNDWLAFKKISGVHIDITANLLVHDTNPNISAGGAETLHFIKSIYNTEINL